MLSFCRLGLQKFMLHLFFFIAFTHLLASYANCAQLTLEWDESPSPGVDGYILYRGTESKNYTHSIDVGNTTSCVISNLEEGKTYYFAATAYYKNDGSYSEGSYSNELSVEVPYPTVPPDDSDGDGILDDEEQDVYGTDPQNADTDRDGLDDGAELDYWADNWDLDPDGDGLINLIDPDSDNDGYLDGIEVDNGYDPMDPNLKPDSVMIWLEAEDGELMPPMTAVWYGINASSGYILVPNGSGSAWDPSHDVGAARYTFQIYESGDYRIWGRVLSPSWNDDSFFIAIDDGAHALWDTPMTTTWTWDQVSNRNNGLDPVVYFLEAGVHTLVVKQREDGTRLDKILVTNDFGFMPTGFGD